LVLINIHTNIFTQLNHLQLKGSNGLIADHTNPSYKWFNRVSY
jgi:hypothetical protein